MSSTRPPKRDPPIVAEPIEAEDVLDVDDAEIEEVHDTHPPPPQGDLTPEEEELLRSGRLEEQWVLRSIPPMAGADPEIDAMIDIEMARARSGAVTPIVLPPPEDLPEEETRPRASTPSPPAPVADENSNEDDEDAIYAELVARTTKRDP